MMINKLIALSLIVALYGCGGSNSSDSETTSTETGVFLDSPVSNIGYRTETKKGVTNSLGEYEYVSGETVTFYIGDLEFPPVTAAGVVTPLNIADTQDTSDPLVVNIIRLLQTLDKDGNPDNGITITDQAKSSATQVNFSLSENDFASSSAVVNLITNAGQDIAITELIATNEAIAHFESELEEEGIISSNIVGAWKATNGLRWIFYSDNTWLTVLGEYQEKGTYSYNSTTNILTGNTTYDQEENATGESTQGIDISGEDIPLSISGNTMSVFEISLSRVDSATSDIVGAWKASNGLRWIFYSDNTWLTVLGEYQEKGTFSYNGTTNILNGNTTYDQEVDATGESTQGIDINGENIPLSISGNTMSVFEITLSRVQ